MVVLQRLLDDVGERVWLVLRSTDEIRGGHLFPEGSTCTHGGEHAGRSRCRCARCSLVDPFHVVVVRSRRTPITPAVTMTAAAFPRRNHALGSVNLPPPPAAAATVIATTRVVAMLAAVVEKSAAVAVVVAVVAAVAMAAAQALGLRLEPRVASPSWSERPSTVVIATVNANLTAG